MILAIFLTIIAILLFSSASGNDKGEYRTNWSTLVPSFNYSSKSFYEQLSNQLAESQIKGLRSEVVTEKEGNSFSASRLYLKVQWKEYTYYMCMAPFGNGMFMSSYLFYKQRGTEKLIGSIPFIGGVLARSFFPVTMYRLDSASMYMTYCHDAMVTVLDDITKDIGFRLPEQDRKPVLIDTFER